MTLNERQLNDVLGVLERMDHGKAMPRFPGRVGRFFRQYKDGRIRLTALLVELGDIARKDGAISGLGSGPAELHPLIDPKTGVLSFPLGDVADTLAVSEELGGLINVVMWLKTPMANAANEIFKTGRSVRLAGDYRWTPTARIAVGGATVDATSPLEWADLRCIKAVADDIGRPPHALEYVLDYRLGPPGIKFFRSICVVRRGDGFAVVPAFGQPEQIEISNAPPRILTCGNEGDAACLLAYREPWSPAWAVVDSVPLSLEASFSHVLAWADYQRELGEATIQGEDVAAIRSSWNAAGLRPPADFTAFNTEHRLLPFVRAVILELRRT